MTVELDEEHRQFLGLLCKVVQGAQALLSRQQQRRPPGDESPEVVHHVEQDVVREPPPTRVRREDREPRHQVGPGHMIGAEGAAAVASLALADVAQSSSDMCANR
jgi:hypothetical protein